MTGRIYTMGEDEKHAQAPLTCAEGDVVKVELPSVPSTGYTWELEHMPEGISFWHQHFAPREGADAETAGAGGADIFRFKVRSRPRGSIRLGLRRIWDDGEAVRSCLLTLMPALAPSDP